MTQMAPIGGTPPVLDRKTRARAAIAGSAGNAIESYDFYAYAYTALYFASAFFPSGDRTARTATAPAGPPTTRVNRESISSCERAQGGSRATAPAAKLGRAHVCTPVTNALLVCLRLLE